MKLVTLCLFACAAAANSPHWAFQPLAPGDVPPLAAHPIDVFVIEHLQQHGLALKPQADPQTLARRVAAGLTGLLPHDEADYELLVDTLLASPQFGERWARHWLDVARFGETDGILTVNEDKPRGDRWRYRDAVIHAINDDLPFDDFVRQQLVKTPGRYADLAQFFQIGTRLQNNADPNDRQWHRLDDMVSTTGNAFLGFSFGCARCHDHPVDPMSTTEYYRLTAIFFDDVKESEKAKRKAVPIRVTEPRVLNAGSWQSPGDAVKPGFLRVLKRPNADWPAEHPRGALAGWLTDVEDGAGALLARVIVNRLWHHHFGQGLVKTPNDFGELGGRPSHPELLDWLAAELIAKDWRLKPIHRLIVTSATYRQSDTPDPKAMAIDADNTLLWQWRPRRLDGEAIRDRLLQVSGALDNTMYGPSISIGGYKKTLPDDAKQWRRSIYLQAHRSVRHPTLGLFDPPDAERSTGKRARSATAEGALFALNSPLAWDLAARFAERVQAQAKTPADQLQAVYRLALSRTPQPAEAEIGLSVLRDRGLNDLCHLILATNEFTYIH